MSKINRFLATAVALESQPIGEATEVSTLESTEQIKAALNAEEDLAKEASAEEAQEAASDEEIIQMNEATATLDETATALESIAQLMDYALSTGTTSVATNGMAMLAMDLALKPVGMSSAMESIALEDDDKDGSKNAKSIGEKAKAIAKSLIEAIVNMFKQVTQWLTEKITFSITSHKKITEELKAMIKLARASNFPHKDTVITGERFVNVLASDNQSSVADNFESFVGDFWNVKMVGIYNKVNELMGAAYDAQSSYKGENNKAVTVLGFIEKVDELARVSFKNKPNDNSKTKKGFETFEMETPFASLVPYFTSNAARELSGVESIEQFMRSHPKISFGTTSGDSKAADKGIASATIDEIGQIAVAVEKIDNSFSNLKTTVANWSKIQAKTSSSLASANPYNNTHVNLTLLKKVTSISSVIFTSVTGMQLGIQLKLSHAANQYVKRSFAIDSEKKNAEAA